MANLHISTNNTTAPISFLKVNRLNELKDQLLSMADGNAEFSNEDLLPIVQELSDNLTESGKFTEAGMAVDNVLGMALGQMGKLSKGGRGGNYNPIRMANTLIGAVEHMIRTFKGGRRLPSSVNRSAGRRGKSRRRGSTRRRYR